jgi:hypothetical protein
MVAMKSEMKNMIELTEATFDREVLKKEISHDHQTHYWNLRRRRARLQLLQICRVLDRDLSVDQQPIYQHDLWSGDGRVAI